MVQPEQSVKHQLSTDERPYKRVELLEDVPSSMSPLHKVVLLACVPLVWIQLLLMLLAGFLRNPLGFLGRRPRSRRPEDVELPPGLEGLVHEQLEVGGGIRLHAVSFGRRPDLPLALFLHGFPECWYSWRRQLVELRERYEVVALDMRGFGWSDKPQSISAYSLDQLAADVAGAVAALGRSACTLVGHDWGGAVAWATAGRYPGLVERLVVAAGPHWLLYLRNMNLDQAVRSSYMIMFQMPVLPELLFTYSDGITLDDVWRSPNPAAPLTPGAVTAPDVEVYKAAFLQPGAPTAGLNYYRAAMAVSLGVLPLSREMELALRRQLNMPVLVVWGANDSALGIQMLEGVAEVAPRSDVHILPRCSHWIQADQPGELSRVLQEWLDANPLPGQQGSHSGHHHHHPGHRHKGGHGHHHDHEAEAEGGAGAGADAGVEAGDGAARGAGATQKAVAEVEAGAADDAGADVGAVDGEGERATDGVANEEAGGEGEAAQQGVYGDEQEQE